MVDTARAGLEGEAGAEQVEGQQRAGREGGAVTAAAAGIGGEVEVMIYYCFFLLSILIKVSYESSVMWRIRIVFFWSS